MPSYVLSSTTTTVTEGTVTSSKLLEIILIVNVRFVRSGGRGEGRSRKRNYTSALRSRYGRVMMIVGYNAGQKEKQNRKAH